MRAVLENSVIVPDSGKGRDNITVNVVVVKLRMKKVNGDVLLQLGLGQNGRQSVSADFGLASSVIGAHVAHALLVRVHVLHVVATLARQGDLG